MPHLLRAWSGRHLLVLSGMRAHEVSAIAVAIPETAAHTEIAGDFTALGYRGVR
jgi:hypothetical protein